MHASRLGELEQVALDPAVEKVVFDHHAGELARLGAAGERRPLRGRGADDDARRHPRRARDRGRRRSRRPPSRSASTRTPARSRTPARPQRDAEALAWCLRHGASQELLAQLPAHAAGRATSATCWTALLDAARAAHGRGASRCSSPPSPGPSYVDGVSNLAHKLVDLTDCKALVAARRDGRARLLRRRAAARTSSTRARSRQLLGGGGHAQAASAIFRGGARRGARRGSSRALARRCAEPLHRARRDVDARRARRPGRDRGAGDGRLPAPRARAGSSSPTRRPPRRRRSRARTSTRRSAHGLSHAPVKGIMSSRVATAARTRRSPSCSALLAARPTAASPCSRTTASPASSRAATSCARSASAAGEEPSAAAPRLAGRARRGSSACSPSSRRSPRSASRYDGVYLVGGTVRDILLGERSFDVDIAVEGDAIALAQALADALGGRVRAHEQVRHGRRALRRRRARRRRHGPHGVLRRAGGAADGRARLDPRGPLPARLHDQRDGRLAQGRRLRPARRPLRRAARPRGEDDPRPPQPLVHRRPDADLPRDPLREPLRLPDGRAHASGSRAGLHRDGPRRRPLVGAAARRARGAARRGRASSTRSCGSPSSAPTRAIHPHLAADEEAVALLAPPARAARPLRARRSPPGGSG